MIRRPPRSTRTDTLFPCTTLFRSPLIGLYLVHLTGWSIFYAFTLFVWYGAIPVFDVLFGKDPNNTPEAAVARLEADRYYRALTWLTVPVHYASLLGCAWRSEARRAGQACVSTFRSRWLRYH